MDVFMHINQHTDKKQRWGDRGGVVGKEKRKAVGVFRRQKKYGGRGVREK